MKTVTLRKPAQPVQFHYALAGSKSFANRALILAALCEGESTLANMANADDTRLLIEALTMLGVSVEQKSSSELVLRGGVSRLRAKALELYVGAAGTTSRFLTALCAVAEGVEVLLHGTERLHERPIGPLVEALRSLGAEIDYTGSEGCLPLRIRGKRLRGGRVRIDGSVSSQYLTALALVGASLTEGLQLEVQGKLVSRSYVEMTRRTLEQFGIMATWHKPSELVIPPASSVSDYRRGGHSYFVEGDATGATYLWNLAALSGGSVRVKNVAANSIQGDVHYARLLESMGCTCTSSVDGESPPWIEVQGSSEPLQAITANMSDLPDAAQSLALVAAYAQGTTTFEGVETLRVKETDRIAAVIAELAKMGIHATDSGADILSVTGGTPRAARIATYEDHRMAMAFATAAVCCDGICIEEPEVVEKSFPTFWEMIASAGVEVHYD